MFYKVGKLFFESVNQLVYIRLTIQKYCIRKAPAWIVAQPQTNGVTDPKTADERPNPPFADAFPLFVYKHGFRWLLSSVVHRFT